MLTKKQIRNLRILYAQGAGYRYIADHIGATLKQVDNYIYKHSLAREFNRSKGKRGGKSKYVDYRVAPVNRLRKDEIIWLSKHFCVKHGRPFLTCYDCYLEENPDKYRVGHLDIETSNLNASYGIILSYCILNDKTGEILGRAITKNELKGELDAKLVTECVRDMLEFDILVTYFGTKFDIPFIRTRAAQLGIDFPAYGVLKHIDLYYVVRNKCKLHRNSLEQACAILLGETHKTVINPKIWIQALQGKKSALDFVLDHNKRDVVDTKALYDKVIDYRYPGKRSI